MDHKENIELTEGRFKEIYLHFFARLCVFAETIVKDQAQAKECVQDVFFEVWNKRASIIINQSMEGYLVRSTYNRALYYIRQSNIRTRNHEIIKTELINLDQEMTSLSDEDNERLEKIDKAINTLPEQCRKVFLLNKRDGKRYKEIADTLGISVKTVDNHISNAVKKIKDLILSIFL